MPKAAAARYPPDGKPRFATGEGPILREALDFCGHWHGEAWKAHKIGVPVGFEAMPRPSTPSLAQAARARVGPKSGPPCFFEPPTTAGAVPFASFRHSLAPGQPPFFMKGYKASPTEASSGSFSGT